MIYNYAQSQEVDPVVAVNIAYEESRFVVGATNTKSSAEGLFQIIDGTWESFNCVGSKFNAIDNTVCAIKIMKTSGTHHWEESHDIPCGNRECGWKYLRYNLNPQ